MENKILTAEEFYESIDENYEMLSDISHIHRTMIEFAKMHVGAAIQSIVDNVYLDDVRDYAGSLVGWVFTKEVNKESIYNAYSLDNIK